MRTTGLYRDCKDYHIQHSCRALMAACVILLGISFRCNGSNTWQLIIRGSDPWHRATAAWSQFGLIIGNGTRSTVGGMARRRCWLVSTCCASRLFRPLALLYIALSVIQASALFYVALSVAQAALVNRPALLVYKLCSIAAAKDCMPTECTSKLVNLTGGRPSCSRQTCALCYCARCAGGCTIDRSR